MTHPTPNEVYVSKHGGLTLIKEGKIVNVLQLDSPVVIIYFVCLSQAK
jgi:hypothetical protein